MKKIIISMAAAVMAFTACVKEQTPANTLQEENLVSVEFTATSDADTKTSLAPGTNNKTSVVWNAGDKISVWDGTANREFTVKSCEGSNAVISGQVSADATSFYAIYPYTQTLEVGTPDNAERDIRFRFPVISTEYAQPGNFPKDRGIAVAVAVDGKFAFQNRTTLLKFSLASDMANVKSISLKGNNGEYIWGTINVEFAGSTVYQGMAYGYDRGDEVTLCNQDGTNLQTGVDYYIALPGINFTKGYTVTVKLDDNKTLSRTSDKAIQMMTKNIYSLASAPISKSMFETPEDPGTSGDPSTSYYAAYMAGQDIVVAGKTYNKKTHSTATLLTSTATITANGLYFVKPEAGQTIKFGGTRCGDVVIVGDVPGTRQTLGEAALALATNGKIAIKNCNLYAGNGVQLINENIPADYVAFDDCHITSAKGGTPLCYASGADKTAIKEFVMVNSDFKVLEANSQDTGGIFMLNCGLTGSSLKFENNIFYVDKSDVAVLKFKITTVASKAESVIMKNNTFINMLANDGDSGFFKDGVGFNNIDIQNNLFYVTGMTRNNTVFMNGSAFGAGTVANNAYYKGDLSFTFRMFNGSQGTPSFAETDLTALDESPFSAMDHTNGVFTKTAAVAAYGATR